jgi:hypothetical protein
MLGRKQSEHQQFEKRGATMSNERGKTGDRKIPFSCPVCGRKTDYPAEELVEGAVLVCSFCKLTLKLHGHMLQEVQRVIGILKGE